MKVTCSKCGHQHVIIYCSNCGAPLFTEGKTNEIRPSQVNTSKNNVIAPSPHYDLGPTKDRVVPSNKVVTENERTKYPLKNDIQDNKIMYIPFSFTIKLPLDEHKTKRSKKKTE
jgi:hypothetical protein